MFSFEREKRDFFCVFSNFLAVAGIFDGRGENFRG